MVFEVYGAVVSVVVMIDKYIDSGQRHGFVEMSSKSEGAAAITGLQGKLLKSRLIDVIEALPLSDKRPVLSGDHKDNPSGTKRKRGWH